MRLSLVLIIFTLIIGSFPIQSTAQPSPTWIDVEGAEGARPRAAVFRPQGDGPFPLVLWIHGAPVGLDDDQLRWTNDLANAGFVAVAGCVFGKGTLKVAGRDPCPDAYSFDGQQLYAVRNVLALIAAGKNLTGVRRDRVGLVGISWGGNVAVLTASSSNEIQAVVSFAGAFTQRASRNDGSALEVVERLNAPLLVFQGTKDTAVLPDVARRYEQAARAARKDVEAHYLPDADHLFIFDTRFRSDVYRLTVEFLKKHLR